MKSVLLLGILTFLTISTTYAQTKKTYAQKNRVAHENTENPLLIGDKLPEISFAIKNYSKSVAKISDFKGKLLLIDLFNVWCGGSTHSMLELEKIRSEFGNKVKILLATKDNATVVKELDDRSEIAKTIKYPTVTGEERLAWLFNYNSVPNYVWVDENMTIKYITQEISTDMVRKYLAGEKLKVDERPNVTISQSDYPILTQTGKYWGNNFKINSYLAPVDESNHKMTFSTHRYALDDKNRLIRITSPKSNLKELYRRAYNVNGWSDRRIIHIGLPDNILNQKWVYDIMVDSTVSDKRIYEYMQYQLDFLFDIKSTMTNKWIKAYVLRRLPGAYNLQSKGVEMSKSEFFDGVLRVRNTNIFGLTLLLNNLTNPPLDIFDYTGINDKVKLDVDIPIDYKNISTMNEALSKYGLVLEEKEVEMPVLLLENKLKRSTKEL